MDSDGKVYPSGKTVIYSHKDKTQDFYTFTAEKSFFNASLPEQTK